MRYRLCRGLNLFWSGFRPPPRATGPGELPLAAACGGKTAAPDLTPRASDLTPDAPRPRLTKRLQIPNPRDAGLQRQRRGIFVDHPTIIKSLAP